MRVALACGFALSVCAQASAQQYVVQQPYYAQQPQYVAAPRMVVVANPQRDQLDLGGGFVEFLFSDRNNRGPQVAAPAQQSDPRPIYGTTAALDPQYYDPNAIDPIYLKQEVPYETKEAPGTVVIDTPNKFLYLVLGDGRALRYGVGVGRPGFTWAGEHTVSAKREWPDWHPPEEMLKRQPWLPSFMAGGPNNPLGARAIYLGSTLYRIHGSNEPWTIGQNVSSGCIRMRNEDVTDLYGRVKVGAKVVVI
jgi:lipoprotein-anchoring transpeptidase ErfK/SrfK